MFPDSFIPKMPLFAPPDLPNVTSVSSVSEADAVDGLFGNGDGDEDADSETEETETRKIDDDEDSEAEGTENEDAEDEETVEGNEETEDEEDTEAASYGPVSKKELLAKYPKLFKDFPGLGNTFAREQKFTELFPTIEEAEEASSLATEYKGFADQIMNGNAAFLLTQVKQINKKSFLKLTDNFLDAVQEVDRDHFNNLLEPYIKRVIRSAFAAGTNVGNENLVNSAQHLSKYLFGNPNVEQLEIKPRKAKRSNDDEEDDSELSQREKELNSRQEKFFQQQFNEKAQAIGQSIDTELGGELDKSIDPHGKMSDYFKRNLRRDIIEAVHTQLKNEPALSRTMQTLWNKARSAGYPNAMMSKIRSTYIQRAKQVLPAVKARIKAEAFKTGKSTPGIKKTNNNSQSRNIPAGRSLSGGSGNGAGKKMPEPKNIDFRRTSDRDILDGNYIPRK